MVLATLLLVCAIPQMDDASKVAVASNAATERPAVSATSDNTTKDSNASATLPSAPEPKVKADADPAAVQPAAAQPYQPVKPVWTHPRETPRQRKLWYALTITGSGAAAFDAWSTRRAISGGYGQEANPFLKPFANSNALYFAVQASPALMDFIGKRMMTSEHPFLRKVWWLPQSAGAAMSFVASAHNVSLVH
jgi:hypothetical protein